MADIRARSGLAHEGGQGTALSRVQRHRIDSAMTCQYRIGPHRTGCPSINSARKVHRLHRLADALFYVARLAVISDRLLSAS